MGGFRAPFRASLSSMKSFFLHFDDRLLHERTLRRTTAAACHERHALGCHVCKFSRESEVLGDTTIRLIRHNHFLRTHQLLVKERRNDNAEHHYMFPRKRRQVAYSTRLAAKAARPKTILRNITLGSVVAFLKGTCVGTNLFLRVPYLLILGVLATACAEHVIYEGRPPLALKKCLRAQRRGCAEENDYMT